jgi:NAD(P)-dependent dehydrogenase (short-subunit alcohol dehydrogenase family)
MKPFSPCYQISKAGLNMYTVLLASEFPSIAINCVCPGWVKTDMGGSSAPRTVEQGASIMMKLSTQEDFITGSFMDENGPLAW